VCELLDINTQFNLEITYNEIWNKVTLLTQCEKNWKIYKFILYLASIVYSRLNFNLFHFQYHPKRFTWNKNEKILETNGNFRKIYIFLFFILYEKKISNYL